MFRELGLNTGPQMRASADDNKNDSNDFFYSSKVEELVSTYEGQSCITPSLVSAIAIFTPK